MDLKVGGEELGDAGPRLPEDLRRAGPGGPQRYGAEFN